MRSAGAPLEARNARTCSRPPVTAPVTTPTPVTTTRAIARVPSVKSGQRSRTVADGRVPQGWPPPRGTRPLPGYGWAPSERALYVGISGGTGHADPLANTRGRRLT